LQARELYVGGSREPPKKKAALRAAFQINDLMVRAQ